MIVRDVAPVLRTAILFGFWICVSGAAIADVPVPQTYGDAMRWYLRAAEDGNADAQYFLGLKYERGIDFPADSEKAAYWYGRAAEQGHAEAQFKLASMYVRGAGVALNPAAAARLFERAAIQGLAPAQYNFGVVLLNGSGVDRDVERALAWISIAAESGLTQAVALRDRLRRSLPAEIVDAARARAAVLRQTHDL